MWRPIKAFILTAVSVVAVPYAVAVLANILYGWPLGPRRYHRALNPRKVLAVNYALLLQLTKLRYFILSLRWRQFHVNADNNQLIRDLPYGSNGNCVDVYLPSSTGTSTPVVVFVYGGTWSSGDKNMYGLLCSELANSLSAVVLCPNYSIYPKGFVDDMVQDISDVLAFAHDHAIEFHGNKNCIILIGHSAGAHLAVMTVLELTLKRLADKVLVSNSTYDELNPRQFLVSRVNERLQTVLDGLRSVECASLNTTVASDVADTSICATVAVGDQSGSSSEALTDQSVNDSLSVTLQSENAIDLGEEVVSESFYFVDVSNPVTDSTQLPDNLLSSINSEDQKFVEGGDFSVIGVVSTAKHQGLEATQSSLDHVPEGRAVAENDVLSSIRLVIGLAGVYDINIHYEYETSRGVEDLSSMARAMYGPQQFDRFSPAVIVRSLPPRTRLPDIHLMHGDVDYTVPEMQSELFGQAVFQHTVGRISETIIVGCGHVDICFDLMDSSRQWHQIVKTLIYQAVNHVIKI